MPTTQIPIEVTYVSKLITLLTQKKKKKKIDNFIYNISYNQLLSIIKIIFFLVYQFCYGHNFFHSLLKQLVESGGQSFSHGSTTNITFIFTTQNLPFQQVVENLLKKNLWKKFVNKLSLCECIYIYIYIYVCISNLSCLVYQYCNFTSKVFSFNLIFHDYIFNSSWQRF